MEQQGPDLPISSAQALVSGGKKASIISSLRVDCGAEGSERNLDPVAQDSGVEVGFSRGARTGGVEQNFSSTMLLLRNLGRFQFLKAAFGRSYSSNVAVLLASAYRDSSNRQAEVVWRALKA